MIVGACGAHRTGKSTLCREFVKKHPAYKFVETSVSAMMKEAGIDPAVDVPIGERIAVQSIILDKLDAMYGRYASMTIFDRTPLDAAAYMLADVQRENVPPEHHQAIVDYVQRAIDVTNRRFSMLFFIPPALKLVDEPGKAPATPGYVEHISQLIRGLKSDERVKVKHFTLPIRYTDMDLRVSSLAVACAKLNEVAVLERMQKMQDGELIQ